jgi:hypothetical protein
MAFGIERSIAAVRPVVRAVVVDGWLFDHGRAGRTRARKLRVPGPVSACGHHYDGLAIDEFAVLNAPTVAFDFQPHLKPEGAAKPVDRSGGIVIVDRSA